MPSEKPVDWIFPENLDQALAELATGSAGLIAGGTTVVDLFKLGHSMPARLVDISRLPLNGLVRSNGAVQIGAMVSNTELAESELIKSLFPALSQAVLQGASQQIRNAASVGGNLLQATRCVYFRSREWRCNRRQPGSGCQAIDGPTPSHAVLGGSSACIAVNPSDMAVALLALDATVNAVSCSQSAISIPLSNFYPLPDQTPHITSNLPAHAVITSVIVPVTVLAQNSRYLKLRGRASYEFATASVAAALRLEDGVVAELSVALGGMGTKPWRCKQAEASLIGRTPTDRSIDDFCDQLLNGAITTPVTSHKVTLARGAVRKIILGLSGKSNEDR